MGLKKNIFYRLFLGILAAAFAFTPLNIQAAQDLEAQSQAAFNKVIESNSWESWPTGPSIYAQSAIVMEADTGMILYAKDVEEKNYPASITKIMTALLALEHCELDEKIEFSYYATHSIEYGSSSIARTEGEILTVEETLYGLMLSSANECANAIAEHISGSNEEFAVLMNEKAKELGCVNTNFANPSGLHDDNHYTCAYDMALITQAALENEDFRRISGTDYYTLRATNKNDEELWMQNHHYMIAPYKTAKYLDDTVFSGKTGYTTDALNTLVTCGERNGMDVIVVTMRTRSTGEKGVPLFTDTAALLDYANNFRKINISENENTFVVGNAYDFSVDSNELNPTASLISIDKNSSVILPNSVAFTDALPSITLEENTEEEFTFSEIESEEGEHTQGPNFITINLKIIFIVIAVILGIILLIFSVYKLYEKNRAKIRKAINIQQKRRFLRRKRYRSRRRRRHR